MPEKKASAKFVSYQLTINHPKEHHLEHDAIKEILAQMKTILYWCMADEIATTGTYHTHLFVHFKNQKSIGAIKEAFPPAHIEVARGTASENRDYIRKEGKYEHTDKAETRVDGTFEEWGELPENGPGQGVRTDIANVYELINMGYSNAEVMAINPNYAGQISRMDKIRQDILEAKYRDVFRELDVTYIFGPTSTGKTRGIMEKHGYGSVYRVTDYSHPFDRYAQERVMCFDEFRSSLPIGDMLNYLDGYPLALPARYAQRQACYETIYIISNIDLKEQYPNVQINEPETWRAFLRRINEVVEYSADGTTTSYGKAIDYVFPPAWVEEAEKAIPIEEDELPL